MKSLFGFGFCSIRRRGKDGRLQILSVWQQVYKLEGEKKKLAGVGGGGGLGN